MTKAPKLTPKTDVHLLYQAAVQSPDIDVPFFDRHFRKLVGRPAKVFREDFCGTAHLSCEWVRQNPERRAVGVDLHGPTLQWGKKHNLSQLTKEQQGRVQLIKANVLDVQKPKADIVAALNFSYCIFKQRSQMLAYVANAHRSLNRDGLFILDAWGGSETQSIPQRDRKRLRDGCTYVWEQVSFDPLSYHTDCRIHFEWKNGAKRRNAFTYDWRLWTVPELKDILAEVGFKDLKILWETTNKKTGGGTGNFRYMEKGSADRGWIAYLLARP